MIFFEISGNLYGVDGDRASDEYHKYKVHTICQSFFPFWETVNFVSTCREHHIIDYIYLLVWGFFVFHYRKM